MTRLVNGSVAGDDTYRTFQETSSETESGVAGPKQITVNEAIERIGFGKLQLWCALAAGLAWVAESMEIMVLALIGPVLICEWQLSYWQVALITTVSFLGGAAGSPVFGYIADNYGRRKSMIMSCCWVAYYGLLSAFAPTYIWLLALRFLLGIGIGGVPQAITYSTEFMPNSYRTFCIMGTQICWALGGAVEVVLALLIMNPFGWRPWLALSAVPSFIFVILSIWIPESPHFELSAGRVDKAYMILKQVARVNGKEMPPGELVPAPVVPRGQVKDLFKPGYKRASILLAFLWFTSAFAYFGIILLSTELVKLGTTCEPDDISESSQTAECVQLTTEDYVDLLWTAAAEVPGVLLTAVFMDWIGRRPTLAVEYALYALCIAVLAICMDRVPMVVVLVIGRAFAAASLQGLYVYTGEVYPTSVRALANGFGVGFNRLGAVVTPYIAQVVMSISLYSSVGVYAFMGVLSTFACVLLPYETRGTSLK